MEFKRQEKKLTQQFPAEDRCVVGKLPFYFSCAGGLVALLLRPESIQSDEARAIFHGRAYVFYAFVISTMCTFIGSLTALIGGADAKFTRFCRLCSLVSMASALSILAYGLIPDIHADIAIPHVELTTQMDVV